MQDNDTSVLRQNILAAFPESLPPTSAELGFDHQDEDHGFLVNRFTKRGVPYREVRYEDLARHSGQPRMLSEAAFCFYLPAYLLGCVCPPVRNYRHADFVDEVLDRLQIGRRNKKIDPKLLSYLDESQTACIGECLRYLASSEDEQVSDSAMHCLAAYNAST